MCISRSVPVLLTVALMILIFGQDHPAGSWLDRHSVVSAPVLEPKHDTEERSSESKDVEGSRNAVCSVHPVGNDEDTAIVKSTVDFAVNKTLTLNSMTRILLNPLTWLPALAYLTTFGVELAIDGGMAGILFSIYNKNKPDFTQTTAGYYTAIL
jgi:NNP family nitrate/nitrite transporter-like MFS transporter